MIKMDPQSQFLLRPGPFLGLVGYFGRFLWHTESMQCQFGPSGCHFGRFGRLFGPHFDNQLVDFFGDWMIFGAEFFDMLDVLG